MRRLSWLPGYRVRAYLRRRFRREEANPFLRFADPGHFYSPLPDLGFVKANRERLFRRDVAEILGVNIDAEGQRDLVRAFAAYYSELPFGEERQVGARYYFRNDFFSYGDAIILYSMMRHFRPRSLIEVGSGFSSAVMLDTADRFLGRDVRFTFVDPHPERLRTLLREEDFGRAEMVADLVQNVPTERFEALRANDILFIDSSHVAKIGSDVLHLLRFILPRLAPGVLVHFHDVFWPFEYPEQWILEGRAWNEDYVLMAFLQFNSAFEILFFNGYMAQHHADVLQECLPKFFQNPGGSLWLRKTA